MTLAARISLFITAVGADVKALLSSRPPVGGAINQVLTKTGAADYAFAWGTPTTGVTIDDTTAGAATVYSSNKTDAQIATAKAAVKNEVLNGAGAAYDTLLEIQNLMLADDTVSTGLLASVAKRVAVDQVQTFTLLEKQQARTNMDAYGSIEIGNPDADLVALYVAAKV